MENEYTILDVIKNSSSLFKQSDRVCGLIYRYNVANDIIEYTEDGFEWSPSFNSLKVFANMKFIKYEPTYTIDDLIHNQGKVYELEDEPTLYTVKGGILYFYSELYRQWLQSDMVYNDVMKQKFVEYTEGDIKYEN